MEQLAPSVYMEPPFLSDLWNSPAAPYYHPKFTVNSWVGAINDAARAAELVDICCTNSNEFLYPLLICLKDYSLRHSVLAWASALNTYHRTWARQELAQVPNAVRLGVILSIQGSFDIKMLSYLYGISLPALMLAQDEVRYCAATTKMEPRPLDHESCLELLCTYLDVATDTPRQYLESITAALEKCGSTGAGPLPRPAPLMEAAIAVYFATIKEGNPPETRIMAQLVEKPMHEFTDLCDFVWCSVFPHSKQGKTLGLDLGLDPQMRYLWYFDQLRNLEAVQDFCSEFRLTDPAVLRQLKRAAMKVPSGVYRRHRIHAVVLVADCLGIQVSEDHGMVFAELLRQAHTLLGGTRALIDKFLWPELGSHGSISDVNKSDSGPHGEPDARVKPDYHE